MNDREQAEAAKEISFVYGRAQRNIVIAVAVLLLLGLGTGASTLQANRQTFEKIHQLAIKLQMQSEQLRRLSWKVIEVQEETLHQVARDLHDEFGQILTAIGTMLARAERKPSGEAPAQIRDVEGVKDIVEETLQKVRDRSQIFRPAILDDFGLQQTLEWFVEQFSRQTGIQVDFEGKLKNGVVPADDAIHLYRIVQEALNNAARHGHAQRASVRLEEQDGSLSLEVRDDGRGFEAGSEMNRLAGGGVGLMGMRERAEHLSGSFSVQSAPGEGTVIQVRVPLKKAARSHVVP